MPEPKEKCAVGKQCPNRMGCSAYEHKDICPAFYREVEKPKFLKDPKKVGKFIEAVRRA
jgi:hypothetical protein